MPQTLSKVAHRNETLFVHINHLREDFLRNLRRRHGTWRPIDCANRTPSKSRSSRHDIYLCGRFRLANPLRLPTASNRRPSIWANSVRWYFCVTIFAKFRPLSCCRRQSFDMIRQLALLERPDLFITDFEPLTAVAARSLRHSVRQRRQPAPFLPPARPRFSASTYAFTAGWLANL